MNDFEKIDENRKNRVKKKKGRKFLKGIMVFLGLVIIALAAFLITVKICRPDFNLLSLVPQQVSSFVEEDIMGKITTAVPTTTTTTTTATQTVDYLEFDEFNFELSKQGNHLGNLLGKGKGAVGTDSSYIYHIVQNKGIYRFGPSSEDYTMVYKSDDELSCLNLRGDFIYFINETKNNLYKLQKGASAPAKIAENVNFAYVYDSNVYYISNDNDLYIMNVKELEPKMLYSAENENRLCFVGISLNRVFFTETTPTGGVKFLTIDNKAKTDVAYFRKSGDISNIISLELENGFFYYYEMQQDMSYNLCRQKFGSDKVVTLLKNVTTTDYVTVDSNRLYYSEFEDSKFRMKELNMNSNSQKTMLSVSGVKEDNTLSFLHGGEYDFIIGEKSQDGSKVYNASCIYTGSTNVMKFKDGKWKY